MQKDKLAGLNSWDMSSSMIESALYLFLRKQPLMSYTFPAEFLKKAESLIEIEYDHEANAYTFKAVPSEMCGERWLRTGSPFKDEE